MFLLRVASYGVFWKLLYLRLQQRVFPWQHFSHVKFQVVIVKCGISRRKCTVISLLLYSLAAATFGLKYSTTESLEMYPLQIQCWSKKLKNEKNYKLQEWVKRMSGSFVTDAVSSCSYSIIRRKMIVSKLYYILAINGLFQFKKSRVKVIV